MKQLRFFLFLCCMGLSGLIQAQEDQSLSPYFWIKGGDPETDALPLKHTAAEVSIAGVIADVQVKQVYQNTGEKPLEAIYVFPASTRAAVYGMTMTIGERRIVAKIKEKQAARQIYTEAKAKGKTASLLEQERPNVFQMNVANIMPGDSIVVQLSYTEMIVPEEGVYEFVYPTVVGPRYSETPLADISPDNEWIQSPYTHEKEAPAYTFDLKTYVSAGMPVHALMSPSHAVQVNWIENGDAEVLLDPTDQSSGNRDYVLRYRLRGEAIQSGLMTYEEAGEKFFLWMVQPPARIEATAIPPREYVFIMDVSGSMNGFPIATSKELMRNLLKDLRPQDRFNVVLFASTSAILSEKTSLPANQESIARAIEFIEKERGSGGTSLLPALNRALNLQTSEDYARTFVICTDGYITVEQEAYDLVRDKLGTANFFTFGIGSSSNRYLVEGLAKVGMGESFVALNEQEAKLQAKKFRTYIESPVLTNVEAQLQQLDAYEIEPPYLPDVFAERPIILFGKYKGELKGEVSLSGQTGNGVFVDRINLDEIRPLERNRA
ncbi:MAG: VIT domain-containing protein, partial [Bacteroidota bacterium]